MHCDEEWSTLRQVSSLYLLQRELTQLYCNEWSLSIWKKLNSRPFAPKIGRVFWSKCGANCSIGSFQCLELHNPGAPEVIEGPESNPFLQ